ncbi:MAG: hypothetical protein A2X59_10820 [Nitrospirae bacterium GWC2_42_7]|nr:MAG: hypothetical protein A2X59_10820 [Nitrospirae bacterium GWC2_42_7]
MIVFNITWSEERVREFLQKENLSYQNIEMPYGLSTGGDDRSSTCKKILPDDLTGKTVLDIGCKFGYFCIEAIKRGARKVVGIDFDPENIRKARMIADCLGMPITYELFDIETDRIQEKYDYVLCLNVLHHLKDPIAVLDRLIEATYENLILEVASLGPRDRKRLKISLFTSMLLKHLPVLFISGNGRSSQFRDHKFFITQSAIRRLLMNHQNMFASVNIEPTEFKDRFIAIAAKRRIGKLLVVAGPIACGKTTLIRKLQNNELPEVAGCLNVDDFSSWRTVNARRFDELTDPVIDKLILYYDIKRPFFKNTKVYERDVALDILKNAAAVSFLTLWTPPDILIEQLDKKEQDKSRDGRSTGKKYQKLRKAYQDFEKIRTIYSDWIEFCQKQSAKHIVVSVTDGVRISTDENWKQLVMEQ